MKNDNIKTKIEKLKEIKIKLEKINYPYYKQYEFRNNHFFDGNYLVIFKD
ncbi:hypothetical protein GCM10011518_22180 [Flavobacterium limi]|uniref:Uncharacterized protein n=1 Tax=Flavobacterium limi TaxID=2045105 RepID=A0ABQ1U7F3_9FLAO|nr:hypothetical protein GCM10011518_22180 [Flavobacterium limi]